MALISNSHICPHLVAILSTQTEGAAMPPLRTVGEGWGGRLTISEMKHPGRLPLFFVFLGRWVE